MRMPPTLRSAVRRMRSLGQRMSISVADAEAEDGADGGLHGDGDAERERERGLHGDGRRGEHGHVEAGARGGVPGVAPRPRPAICWSAIQTPLRAPARAALRATSLVEGVVAR